MNTLNNSAVCLLLACAPAMADTTERDSKFYLGIGRGSSDFTGQLHEHFPYLPGQRPAGHPDTKEFYVGFKKSENLAFEFGHARFDDVYKTYALVPGIVTGIALIQFEWIDFERNYLGIALSRKLFDRLSLIGQIGYSRFDVQETWSNSPNRGNSHGLTFIENLDADGIYYGLGARLQLPGSISIRWLWTSTDAAIFDLRMSRISLEYSF